MENTSNPKCQVLTSQTCQAGKMEKLAIFKLPVVKNIPSKVSMALS